MLEFARFSTSLRILAMAQNYMEWGHGKNVYWEGGHPTYFLDGGHIWGGEKTLSDEHHSKEPCTQF